MATPHVPGEEPDPEAEPRRDRRSGLRYSLVVGAAFIALAVVAVVNTVGGEDAGILGTSDDPPAAVPEFALPELVGSLDGDANVFQDDCESSQSPCPEGSRRTPACEVELEDAIRVCDLFDRPLAISFWFAQGGECLPAQDAFDTVARRFEGRANFLSIDIRDEREEAAAIVRERGWRVPVGWDADGAVSNLFRVGGCPTVALVYPGGTLAGAAIGDSQVNEDDLAKSVRGLIADSRERELTVR
ncbi:hypothetical protein HJD18_04345 [Thermoleophilia bacterium SCSIO 60948]|nr:hypothetical protein HJD18_04345 [Thermoleophilia bacterium SCSIO 60948]